jgi:subtilisin-like proprotein convertase family protein
MIELGNIVTEPCLNIAPPPTAANPSCSDAAFSLANPTICGTNLKTLILKPSTAICCLLGSVQLSAIVVQNGVETDVTAQTIFTTSDPDIAVVGASSGNVTGLAGGDVIINASYSNLAASCSLTVIGETHCCDAVPVAFMVLVDDSKSMSQTFNSAYATKLTFAKSAASQFIAAVNATKDSVGLMSFDDSFAPVLSAPSSNIAAVGALVSGITQSQQLTGYNAALTTAIAQLTASTATEKVLLIISDGEDTSVNDATDSADAINTINTFKSGGGIVICLGVRATGNNFLFLEALATGGFFINAYDATAAASLQYLMGLKGYLCAGNCTPTGDKYVAQGQLDYCNFANWNVVNGHVDLIGNGFLDFLPGNGLYVDLAGSTAPHGGAMISKNTFNLLAGHSYRLSLELAGNQRINVSPNTVQFAVFSRNTDGLTNPASAPSVTVNDSGASLSTTPTYKYAYTYVNANGETIASPSVSATPTTAGASMVVQCAANGAASNIKIYRTSGASPDSPFYEIAEIANTAPAYTDYMNLADFEAALVAGTVDPCAIAPTANTTGTPIYYLNQSVTLNNFQQAFTPQSFNFSVPANVAAWVSIQQTGIPSAASASGLLLDQVSLDDTTSMVNLLSDNFDNENQAYVPPACGIGTTYVQTGNSGGTPVSLVPIMTDLDSPSGVVSSNPGNMGEGFAFEAFDEFGGLTGWQGGLSLPTWLQYQFPYLAIIYSYIIQPVDGFEPQTWVLQGSNDGSAWTTLDTQTAVDFSASFPVDDDGKYTGSFSIANPSAYFYYRITISVAGHNQPEFHIKLIGTPSEATFGYVTGYNCYGSGCLNIPPAIQLQDPNPLPSIEAAATTPTQYVSTKTVCVGCPTGSTGIPLTALTPIMTSNTQPSGIVSDDLGTTGAWRIFSATTLGLCKNQNSWVQYQFPSAQTASFFCFNLSNCGNGTFPSNILFNFQGSNDGATWTTLNTQLLSAFPTGNPAYFQIQNPQSFLYYRLNIVSYSGGSLGAQISNFSIFGSAAAQVCATASATSLISQSDADNKATTSATTQAQTQLDCLPSWTATESYTATCSADFELGSFGQNVTQSATYTSFISLLDAQNQATALAKVAAVAMLSCNNSNNGQQIVINDDAAASPYPSVDFVTGQSGHVTKVTVAINGFTHARSSDVQLVLRSPDGTMVLLMWDCGGSHACSNVNLVFDDAAGSSLTSAAITSGTYKPTSLASVPNMPTPLPNPPYNATLAAFIGVNPNGAWSLWVADNAPLDAGTIGSWSVTITSA